MPAHNGCQVDGALKFERQKCTVLSQYVECCETFREGKLLPKRIA